MDRKTIYIIFGALILGLLVKLAIPSVSPWWILGLVIAGGILQFVVFVGVARLSFPPGFIRSELKERKIMIWGGLGLLILAPIWFFAAVAITIDDPKAPSDFAIDITLFPVLLFLGVGLCSLGCGILLRYMR